MISTDNHIAILVVAVSNVIARHRAAASKTVGLPRPVGRDARRRGVALGEFMMHNGALARALSVLGLSTALLMGDGMASPARAGMPAPNGLAGRTLFAGCWRAFAPPPKTEETAQAKPQHVTTADDERSLIERLRQFIRDNPTSPKLQTVYSSLLFAAARYGDPDILLGLIDETVARFPQSMANSVTSAMRAFREARGETPAASLAQKLIEEENSPRVLLMASEALPGYGLRLLERAIGLREKTNSADESPTVEQLRWAYVAALDKAERSPGRATRQKDLIEQSKKRMAELEALPKDNPARSSLPLVRASLADRHFTLAHQAASARQYERALEYVALSQETYAGGALKFQTRCDIERATIYAAMKRPDLELEAWLKVFANSMETMARNKIRELAVVAGREPEQVLERSRDLRARSATPVPGFNLKALDGRIVSLLSLTSKNKVTLFNFFFPT
jgi:hypothetical protein